MYYSPTTSIPTINGRPLEQYECALCRAANLPNLEATFTPQVLEASEKNLRGLGLQETLMILARQGGYPGDRMSISDGNLHPVLQAVFSVHSATTLISQAGSKFLNAGFGMSKQTWKQVSDQRQVQNFKQHTCFRLTSDLEYEQLAPGGEIQHGTAGQESFTVQASTYAKMFSITREDIINDDLGAFDDVQRRLGLGAAQAIDKAFWTTWLGAADDGDFWTADRGNYAVVGAGLTTDTLALAVKAFRDLPTPDGSTYHHLDLEPARLLCGPSLEPYALQLYNSSEIRDTNSSSKYATANIWENRFNPVIESRLENSAYTGYSTTNWWLCADPKVLASATVATLNGKLEPTVETADADFSTLGIQLRGYHDFGIAMSEYRASTQCVPA